jgi:hypothetical protein
LPVNKNKSNKKELPERTMNTSERASNKLKMALKTG